MYVRGVTFCSPYNGQHKRLKEGQIRWLLLLLSYVSGSQSAVAVAVAVSSQQSAVPSSMVPTSHDSQLQSHKSTVTTLTTTAVTALASCQVNVDL